MSKFKLLLIRVGVTVPCIATGFYVLFSLATLSFDMWDWNEEYRFGWLYAVCMTAFVVSFIITIVTLTTDNKD